MDNEELNEKEQYWYDELRWEVQNWVSSEAGKETILTEIDHLVEAFMKEREGRK